MKKCKIIYYEDFLIAITEIVVKCNDERELGELAYKYHKKNLSHLDNIADSNWHEIK